MERNVTLDCFKMVSSILVITIHIDVVFSSGSLYGWFISDGIARMAVPIFFIINGYYFFNKVKDADATKKYILHLLLIHIVWSFIYLTPLLSAFKAKTVLYYFLMGYYHLWYIPALISGIALLYVCKRYLKLSDNLIIILAVVIFIAGYFLEPMRTHANFIRNGLFLGFPFIALGYYIRSNSLYDKIKARYLIPILIISLAALLFDSYLAYGVSFRRDIYLGLMLCCPAVFLLILKHSVYKPNNDFLSYFGSFASAIYFVHIYVIRQMVALPEEWRISKLPIILFLASLLSIVILYINKRVKIFI